MSAFYPTNNGQIIYQTAVTTRPYESLDCFWRMNVDNMVFLQAHQEMRVPKFGSTNPLQAGFVQTYIEEAKGQIANYRMTLPDGRGIHLLEFLDCYMMHWDKKCPLLNPIEHIKEDAPQYAPVLAILAVAGIVGFAVLLASGSN